MMTTKVTLFLVTAMMATAALAEETASTAPAAANKKITTTTATTVLASAEEAGTNQSFANDAAAPETKGIRPSINYTGFFYGPGMDFSAAKQSTNNGQEDMYIHNRPKVMAKFGDNIEAGIDPRFNIILGSNDYKAQNDNYRLFANFKNVLKNEVLSLTLTPRIDLPTSAKSHNRGMLPSPELITTVLYTPKNTRFSANGGFSMLKAFYNDSPESADQQKAYTFDIQPWVELDYQITPSLQAMAAWWPDYQTHMDNKNVKTMSNEIDLGANWDFTKGWTLIPYVAIEPVGMSTTTSALQNFQLNMIVTGTVF